MPKKEKTTVQIKKRWERTHNIIKYGKFAMPLIPATVVTAVNWDEWFGKQGVGLPFGFATLLIAILITLFSYFKAKNEEEHKYSQFFTIGAVLAAWGVAFMLLSNILYQMGLMFVFVVSGVFFSGVIDQFDSTTVNSKIKEYNELVDEYNLDKKKSKAKAEKEKRRAKAQAEHEAILKAEQESATE